MEFMVSASFRSQDQAEILARIPQEQARIQTLREQGTVEALYISSDRSHVWIVMQRESQDQVQKDLESLPLYTYKALFEPVVGIGLVVEGLYLLVSRVSVQLDGFDEGAVRFQVNDCHSRFPGLVLQSL
jgi:muconolactone delta-isomerase